MLKTFKFRVSIEPDAYEVHAETEEDANRIARAEVRGDIKDGNFSVTLDLVPPLTVLRAVELAKRAGVRGARLGILITNLCAAAGRELMPEDEINVSILAKAWFGVPGLGVKRYRRVLEALK